MIAILNYGSGNITAIGNILELLGCNYFFADKQIQLEKATHIILPGVGAFDETIKLLHKTFDLSTLEELVLKNRIPFLGICVGMQILSEGSEEGSLKGFGWIKGHVVKFNKTSIPHLPKIPHLGWNTLNIKKKSALLDNINENDEYYFLHSYHMIPSDNSHILSVSDYGIQFVSSVQMANVFGVQFHPEKSHINGINIFRNFSRIIPC